MSSSTPKVKFQKTVWNVLNVPIQIYFFFAKLFGFPAWERAEKNLNKRRRIKWKETFVEEFDEIDPTLWHVTNPGNWGSARPDNICVFTTENVTCEDGIATIHSKKQKATGKGYYGKLIDRDYTSGYFSGKFDVPMDQVGLYRAKMRCQKDLGSWKAFWLFMPGSNERYQEIDGFEQFAGSEKHLKNWQTTTWWGKLPIRNMFARSVNLENKGDWFIFDIVVKKRLVFFRINGVVSYVSGIGLPKKGDVMSVIFSDAVSDHGHALTTDEIDKHLPFKMEIDYFKAYTTGKKR